jgi:putative hydrolase of the HAD superfamily
MSNSTMVPIESVILDFGNVISEPQSARDIESMAQLCGVDGAGFSKSYWHFRLDYDRCMSASTYWTNVAHRCGASISDEQVDALILIDSESWANISGTMLAWIGLLQSCDIPLALLSNMPAPVGNYLLSSCNWLSNFDHVVFSSAVGYVKPEIEIYEHCLRVAGMQPEKTLFLDDRPENIAAAQSLNIHAFQFKNPDQAFEIIRERYNLPCPGEARRLSAQIQGRDPGQKIRST